MKDLMKNLKQARMVSNHEYKLLAHSFNGVSKELFENQVSPQGSFCWHIQQVSELGQYQLTVRLAFSVM